MEKRQVNVFNVMHSGLGGLHVLGGHLGFGEGLSQRNQAQTISKVLGEIGDLIVLRDEAISPVGEGLEEERSVRMG